MPTRGDEPVKASVGRHKPAVFALVKRYPYQSAGAAVGVLALGVVTGLLLPRGRGSDVEARVDAFRKTETRLSPADRHLNVSRQVEEISDWIDDPSFAKLSQEKQDFVQARRREFVAYLSLGQRLSKATDPANVTSEDELKNVRRTIESLKIPKEYEEEWRGTEHGMRYKEMADDYEAIAATLSKIRSAYQKVIDDGRRVLETAAEPKLPARAQAVLDMSTEIPKPSRDSDKPIPGSIRVTFATIFQFADIQDLCEQQWPEIEAKLRPLAGKR
jgi:hypothetical protein